MTRTGPQRSSPKLLRWAGSDTAARIYARRGIWMRWIRVAVSPSVMAIGSWFAEDALGINAKNVRLILYVPEGKRDEPRTGARVPGGGWPTIDRVAF